MTTTGTQPAEAAKTRLQQREGKELIRLVHAVCEYEKDLRRALAAPVDTDAVVTAAEHRRRCLDDLGNWIRERTGFSPPFR